MNSAARIQDDAVGVRGRLHDVTSLTRRCRLSAELLSQVGAFGQAVQVPLQDVPAHLVVEGETELGMNLKMSNTRALKFCFLVTAAPCLRRVTLRFQILQTRTLVLFSISWMVSCIGMLKLCKMLPPNTSVSSGV